MRNVVASSNIRAKKESKRKQRVKRERYLYEKAAVKRNDTQTLLYNEGNLYGIAVPRAGNRKCAGNERVASSCCSLGAPGDHRNGYETTGTRKEKKSFRKSPLNCTKGKLFFFPVFFIFCMPASRANSRMVQKRREVRRK